MIDVQNLSYTYPGRTERAVKGISFSVAAGEIFGFLGPSGAGKSTTQKILTGLLKGYQGAVTVLGKPLHTWRADYYEQIGVSFELPNHFQKLSALENLNYFRSLYAGATEEPLKLLALVGLAADANTRVGQFSKGMQMRLNFVRALLHKPKLIFLDEPTSGMDPVNARTIREIVRGLKQSGCTIFLTTHSMQVADELCDRVAFMVDGQIAALDSPRAMKIQHGQRRVRIEWGQNGQTQQQEFALDGLADNAAFLQALRQPIETIHSKEATLEDIFVQVTGRALA